MFDQSIKLTLEQIYFYEDNGYLVLENALSSSECEKAIEVFEYHAKKSNNTEYSAVMNLDRPEEWRHVYGSPDHWVHRYIRQMLIKHPTIITAMETLQGTPPGYLVVIQTQFLYKKVGTDYAAQAWNSHQDGTYVGSPYGSTLTANTALTDQNRENGCLFIYPGSHKVGRFLESEKGASYHEKPGQRPGHDVSKTLPEEYRGKEIDLEIKQGSILCFHSGVVHGSYPNISKDHDRPMFQAPYKTVGVPFSYGTTGKRMEIPIR